MLLVKPGETESGKVTSQALIRLPQSPQVDRHVIDGLDHNDVLFHPP
jgi:hypothetical protein